MNIFFLVIASVAMVGCVEPGHTVMHTSIPGLTDVYSTTTIFRTTGAAVGPDGALWFSEGDFGSQGARIHKITTAGDAVDIKLPSQGGGSNGIARGPDGSLWITQEMDRDVYPKSGPDRLLRLLPSGTFKTYAIPTANGGPAGVAVDSMGDVWFTEQSAGKIGCLLASGRFKEYALDSSDSDPEAIATGENGDVWFVEQSENRIGLLNSNGAVRVFSPLGVGQRLIISIATDDRGNLWAVSDDAPWVVEITGHSEIRKISLDGGARGLTRGSNGSMWFVSGQTVSHRSQDGRVTKYTIPLKAWTIIVGSDGNLWLTVEPIAEGAGDWTDVAKFSLK